MAQTPPQLPAHFGRAFTKTTHETPSASIDPSKVTLPDGYTVLITGAGKGIGEHIARSYAQAKASNIVITARTASDLDKVKGDLEQIAAGNGHKLQVRTLASDASKLETFTNLKSVIDKEFGGRLDCLVNNAAAIGSNANFTPKLHDTDPEEHARLFELNYLGPMYAMQTLIPLLVKSDNKGRLIVNITSAAAHMTSGPSPIAYNVSKHALNRLTQSVAENYKDDGLVAIALHPGGVKSYSAQFVPDWMKASMWHFEFLDFGR